MNDAVALSKLPSAPVAFTMYVGGDGVPLIVTVQLNLPDESVVAPQTPIDAPPLVASVIASLGENPVPDTRTETPLGPWVGVRAIVGVVIVKGAVALSKTPSDPVAFTVYTASDAGPRIATGQLKSPDEPTVAPHAPIVPPLSITNRTVTPGVYPVPDASTETPLGPCVGVRLSPTVVTMNGAVALSKLPSDPVAVIVYVIAGPLTVNVQSLNVPAVGSVVHELADPITPLPSIVNVTVTPGVNPLPDAVTVTPLGPCVGDSVTAGVVIANPAVALSKLPSDPVAVIVYVVAGPLTVNVQSLNVPAVGSVVHELADPITPLPSIVNVTVTPGVNPLPDAVTVTPLGPCVGDSVTAGVVIVNPAVALSKLPSDPVAVIVYVVAGPLTVNVQSLNVPAVGSVVHELADPITPLPSIVNVTVTPGVNPLPDAVTVTPLGPCVGDSVTAGVVIVNPAVALSKLPSDPVAVIVYVVAGPLTVNVQSLNVPAVGSVVHELADPITPLPSIVNVTVTPGVNPLPDAVTVTPLGPCVGDNVTAGVVIANPAVALSKLPSDPVAVIVYVVAGPLTVNVQSLNVPAVGSVVHELADPITPLPSIVNVTVTPGVNPLPDAVTVTPLGPCVGDSVTAGVVIVNPAVALSKLPSDPVAVIVYVVAGPLTVNVQSLNVPAVGSVVHELADPITPLPSIVNVTVTPGVNPLPDAVTVTPLGPCVGDNVTAGVVIANPAVALSKLPSDPVAVIVYVVAGPLTVNVQSLNVPAVGSVVHELADPITPLPSIVNVTVTPGVNPLPDAVTVTPLGPCVGDNVTAGVVIANPAVALSKLPSDPVAVIVYVVAGPLTVNVQSLNVPAVGSVVHELADPITPLPSIVNVTVTPGVNPLPDAVTVTPLGPCVGDNVTAGVVIVNPAVALSKLPSDPVAVIVYSVDDAVPEIVSVQLKSPDESTVAPHASIPPPTLIVSVTVAPG